MTISLSIDAICAEILAESAMRHYLRADRPEPLTPDRRVALRQLITGAFASTALEMSPYATEATEMPDGDTLRLEIRGDPDAAPQIRRSIEHIIALRVMARVYAAVDASLSARLAANADTAGTALTGSLRPEPAALAGAQIRPHRI